MLINYAQQTGCWIVEDDYDSEFRFEGRPLASGLHLVLLLPDEMDDVKISNEVRAQQILARPLSYYYQNPGKARRGLLLDYACVPEDLIDHGVRVIAEVIGAALSPR